MHLSPRKGVLSLRTARNLWSAASLLLYLFHCAAAHLGGVQEIPEELRGPMPKNEADFLDMLARAHPSHPAPCCRPKSITSQTGAPLEYRKMYRAVLVQHGGFDPVSDATHCPKCGRCCRSFRPLLTQPCCRCVHLTRGTRLLPN